MPEVSPLWEKRIVVTRPRTQADGLLQSLDLLGAVPIAFPTIAIEPDEELSELDGALNAIERYDWVIFTSKNGVHIVFERMSRLGIPIDRFKGRRIAAIGPATAEALRARSVEPDLVPEEFVAEGISEALKQVEGLRFLLPRSAGARPALPRDLVSRGGEVDEIHIYRPGLPAPDPRGLAEIQSGSDALTFTSPSTVRNFLAMLTEQGIDPFHLPGEPEVACIGPITAKAASEAGFRPAVVAERYTAQGLVEALERFYRAKGATRP